MGNTKASTFKVQRDAQKGEFVAVRPRQPYAPLETIRRDVQRRSILPVRDPKTGLSNCDIRSCKR